MRIYSKSDREALRARKLLKEWKDDGHLSEAQCKQLQDETVSELRTTNIFLRIVLWIFTAFAVAAVVGLFFVSSSARASGGSACLIFMVFAVISYGAAELAAGQGRLYRYGIEEALAVCSVALLCMGLVAVLLGSGTHSEKSAMSVIGAVGVVASLWIWRRFGLWYAFPAAMIFAVFVPMSLTSSHATLRCLICTLYAVGLFCVAGIRARHHLNEEEGEYSLAEAFLCVGIYLVFNLKITAIDSPSDWLGSPGPSDDFSTAFYWTTWVVIWCLPPAVLASAIRGKDRFLLAAGLITMLLTFITNKPYLGWQRHTWDPMLLGVVLIGIPVYLFRWFARGPGGVRHGFTAERLAGKHKRALSIASSAFALASTPHATAPPPEHHGSQPSYESGYGGDSGGGGASGDF